MRLRAFLSDERCLAPVGTSTEKRNFGRRFSGKNRLRTDVCRSDGFARPFAKSDLRVPLFGNGPKCPCLDRSGDRFLSVPEGNRHSMRKACRSEYTSHCGVARWIGGKGCVRFLGPGTGRCRVLCSDSSRQECMKKEVSVMFRTLLHVSGRPESCSGLRKCDVVREASDLSCPYSVSHPDSPRPILSEVRGQGT